MPVVGAPGLALRYPSGPTEADSPPDKDTSGRRLQSTFQRRAPESCSDTLPIQWGIPLNRQERLFFTASRPLQADGTIVRRRIGSSNGPASVPSDFSSSSACPHPQTGYPISRSASQAKHQVPSSSRSVNSKTSRNQEVSSHSERSSSKRFAAPPSELDSDSGAPFTVSSQQNRSSTARTCQPRRFNLICWARAMSERLKCSCQRTRAQRWVRYPHSIAQKRSCRRSLASKPDWGVDCGRYGDKSPQRLMTRVNSFYTAVKKPFPSVISAPWSPAWFRPTAKPVEVDLAGQGSLFSTLSRKRMRLIQPERFHRQETGNLSTPSRSPGR